MKRFLCILALALVTLGGFAQTQKGTQSKTTPKTTQTTQKSAQTKAKTATTQTKSATTQAKSTAKSAQTQAKSATTQTKSAPKTTQSTAKSATTQKQATSQKSAANQKTSQKSAQDKKKEQEKKDKEKKEKDKTRFGLTGGIGLHTYKSHHVAFQAKLGGDVRFPVFVDGLYALAGGRLAYRTCGTQRTGRMSNLYLEVPLNLGYTFDLSDNFGLFAEAGPYMGLILAKLNYEYDHNNCGFRPIDIGIGLNLGVEMMKSFRLSLGFDFGFISPCGSDHAYNGGIWLTGTYLF